LKFEDLKLNKVYLVIKSENTTLCKGDRIWVDNRDGALVSHYGWLDNPEAREILLDVEVIEDTDYVVFKNGIVGKQ
jgi:hypothetical protein